MTAETSRQTEPSAGVSYLLQDLASTKLQLAIALDRIAQLEAEREARAEAPPGE